MPTTSIKVPVELRDRVSALARRHQMTLAAAITDALDVAESAEFWERVRASMPERRSADATAADDYDRTLADGLDPDEDWSDVRGLAAQPHSDAIGAAVIRSSSS